MVYAAAYCPKSFQAELEELGFDGKQKFDVIRLYYRYGWLIQCFRFKGFIPRNTG